MLFSIQLAMGYWAILRPVNCTIAFVSVLVGAWISSGIVFSHPLLLAGMVGFIVCGFGNIVNDLYDIEIDRINNPHRPLPKGTVKKNIVVLQAIFLFVIAATFSFNFGTAAFLLVISSMIILTIYAAYLKKIVLSNVIVAVVSGLSFILGGIVNRNIACVFPFLFALFVHIPREIIKDVQDLPGDKNHGVSSLPITLGKKYSFIISAVLLGILCMILPIPYIMNVLNVRYLITIIVFAYPILIYTMIMLLKKPPEDKLPVYSNLLKISMGAGLVAMIV
jgi:geranylgeranylglycerol-phosphate geranylgeranyltransferase